ncbi:MAG: hypothetical protein ACQESG_00360 [Nanobdellota archaeon]
MSQLYELRDGSLGHACDIARESRIIRYETLGDLMYDYISEMQAAPYLSEQDQTLLGTIDKLTPGSLDSVARIEQSMLYSGNEAVRDHMRQVAAKYTGLKNAAGNRL